MGKFGNVAKRRVNTIFDKDIAPWSNMVLGEVLNDRGNWSGYLPHRHPQPECYYFKFDRPEGFGASFVGDQVFKSVDNSFSAIPGGCLHPQAVAPGFQMYTCWMIDPKTAREAKQRQKEHSTNLLYGTIGVVFLVIAIAAVIWKSNIIPKTATAATVNGEKYTAAEVNFYFENYYQNFVNGN